MNFSLRFAKTFLTGLLLLSSAACFVSPVSLPPTQTPTPSPTLTPTPVWFPPSATPSPFPTLAVSPTVDLRTGIGALLLEDDFSEVGPWSTGNDDEATVLVDDGLINLSLKSTDGDVYTTRTEPVFKDFYVEVTANPNFCRGEDKYGLVLRASEDVHYRLVLSCDGRARVERYNSGGLSPLVSWVESGAVPAVAPSSSRLAAWASGSQMHFFVNELYLFSVSDTSLFEGTLGVFAHTAGEEDMSVSFSDLQVWAVVR